MTSPVNCFRPSWPQISHEVEVLSLELSREVLQKKNSHQKKKSSKDPRNRVHLQPPAKQVINHTKNPSREASCEQQEKHTKTGLDTRLQQGLTRRLGQRQNET